MRHKIHITIERHDKSVRLRVLLGTGARLDQIGTLAMYEDEWEMFKEILITGTEAKDVPLTIDELTWNEKRKALYPTQA